MKKILISDGVGLNIIKTDKFKTNYLSFNFVTPLKKETATLNALISQVLIRGTQKHPDIASIKNVLDDLYAVSVEGRVYRRGEYQISGISASWLVDKYAIDGTNITEGTLDIVEELLFLPYLENGAFSEKYVESEKQILIDDIRAIINNKNAYAIRRCQEEMCKDEAFGVCEYGNEEIAKKITSADLYNAYLDLIKKARIEIFYVGSGDEKQLCEKISAMFKSVEREYSALPKTVVKRTVEEVREVTEKCPVAQGKLSLGFRTGSVLGEDMHRAFPVFIEMYGNSPVSKLFMNVREKLSLCYYCRAVPEGTKGITVVTSGIEVKNKQIAQDEILFQLESVRKGDFTEEDILLAKKSLKNAYNELYDSPVALEGWYLTRCLLGLDDTPESVCDGFMSVTKQEIVDAANRLKLDTIYFLEGTLSGEEEEEYDE